MSDETGEAGAGGDLIGAVADWLMAQALGRTDLENLFDGCCRRLRAAGVPLTRAYVSYRTLHPLLHAQGITWRPDAGTECEGFSHGISEDPSWLRSPFFHMIENGIPFLRRRLAGDEALIDFPILAEFRDAGATDYLAYLVPFGDEDDAGIAGSWMTDRPSGFGDQDIRALGRIQHRLAVACKVRIKEQITRNIVTAYLGPKAGLRVLEGQIKRGDGESVHAVIWYSDLRDSTRFAESLPARDYLDLLNAYFECTAGAVIANGGEVLLLIGDAVLAIFPCGTGNESQCAACGHVLDALHEAEKRLAGLNAARAAVGREAIDFGLGLHVGDLMFGNIGVPERLQFTVVGPAANEVARLEALAREAGRRVVASAAFMNNVALDWESLGPHSLRGVGQPIEVFAPPVV
ncbi:MAG: adenylate/guanylate cyclase domain-containing protein [Alphaproteobacteria bacterium]